MNDACAAVADCSHSMGTLWMFMLPGFLAWLYLMLKPQADLDNWHRWFAWRPVKTLGGIRWLCFLERHYRGGLVGAGDLGWWEYRDIE